MKTAKTQPLPSGPNSPGSARGTRRRQWPLMIGTAVVVVLFILGCRWMVGDSLAVFEKVARQDCQDDGYCVSWVSYPELLVAGGRQEVHVYQAGHAGDRFYVAPDPFQGDLSGVSVTMDEEGVSITDGSVTLSWSAQTLERLGD
ncbi:hypothetical protein LWF15_14510 [Kineosporia rhizophila]|uniref:hypothetical protein n=1 Tax=Kineosporia rhizophila TaxID=84633 RepID=UPI001E5D7711|nr:hypothetical protein [Kineosporia rhizophila]MCE0536717.1 hypothetical protein [Kineosporia rhizophila]